MNKEYKCPCCGGAINFDTDSQNLKCPFCDTEFDVQAFTDYENNSSDTEEISVGNINCTSEELSESESDGISEYVCESCGGNIVCETTTASAKCPYCGNPVVMTGNVTGMLKPNLIIPFKKSKEDAKAAYYEHLKGKPLLPDTFRDENHIDEIKGVYVPFWLFDADTKARIRFKTTRVKSWDSGDYRYTETRYYSVVRGGNVGFDRIPVDGSTKMPDDIMESIEPFDVSEAQAFNSAYFAGYMADKYDVDSDQCVERSNERIRQSTEDLFRGEVTDYDSVTTEHSQINITSGQVQYAMYPVWLLSTTWHDKNYIFAMNGQTGKLVGDLPVDKKKYWTRFLLFSVLFTAIVLGIAFLTSLA
ncbi:MAG: hypothetical protein IJO93_06770 [Clostridia bacterium]|nr:hypothetical protein [Clostridia bacterium]